MLYSNDLMFSRTESKDYRWLFRDSTLIGEDLYHILSDYGEFETYKEQYLHGRYMIVRKLCNGAAIYSFSKLNKTDQYSRNIYALIGYTFTGLNGDIFKALVQFMCGYLYYLNDFDAFSLSVTDETEELEKKRTFSIDKAIANYRRSTETQLLTKAVESFIEQNQWEAFIIKDGTTIEAVPAPNYTQPVAETVQPSVEDPVFAEERAGLASIIFKLFGK